MTQSQRCRAQTSRRLGWLALLLVLVLSPLAYWYLPSAVEVGLVRALGGRIHYTTKYVPPARIDIIPGPVTVESFRACAEGVPGWDLIVVVGPYGWGPDVLDDPLLAGQSEGLRSAVKLLVGFPDDGVFGVAVIRDDRIAARFWLTGPLSDSFVIACHG